MCLSHMRCAVVNAQRVTNYRALSLPSVNDCFSVFGSGDPDGSAEESGGAEEADRPGQSDG